MALVNVISEFNMKIKECEVILSSIPTSTLKMKANSVQGLLVENSELIAGNFSFNFFVVF